MLTASIILLLALTLPLARLAATTSFVTLTVFTVVNLSLWQLGSQRGSHPTLFAWRYWGIASAVLCFFLLVNALFDVLYGGGSSGFQH